MTSKQDWIGRVGDAWAREWRRTDRSFAGLTSALIDRAHEILAANSVGTRKVLDLGCGAGELACQLGEKGVADHIIGLDLSESLIAEARERAAAIAEVSFETGDASTWSKPDFDPDLILSRHGVMFFDDPIAAFTHLQIISAPSGQLLFSCFRSPSENEWGAVVTSALPIVSAPMVNNESYAPGPFAFAKPDTITEILSSAGWGDITIEPVDFAYTLGAGDDPVADAIEFLHHIGPAAQALRSLDGDEKIRCLEAMSAKLLPFQHDGRIAMNAAAWIVSAKA